MKNFLAVIASIVLFISILFAAVLFNTSQFLKRETITKTVEKVSLVELSKEQTPQAKQVKKMMDTLYKKASTYGIDEKTVNSIIESDSVKAYVGDIAASLSEYVLTGKEGKILTKEEFNRMFEKNIDSILDNSSLDITEKEKQEFKEFVEENSDDIIESIPTVEQIALEVPAQGLQSLRVFFSPNLKIGAIVGIVLSSILIIFLSLKNKKWLKYLGTTLLLAGLFIFALGLVLPVIFKVISDILEGYIVLVFNHFLKPYAYKFIVMGLIGMIFATVLLVIYAKVKKNKKVTA